ncbi:MAG: hypothetical protein KAY24_05710 [Candidatus Eisenbacteria sp.]|nr:hypothetical protein [Candidatus Eisenbacteria bacterium]
MATNPEFRRTVVIGLGGAGQQIALRTKRLFLDAYGILPPCVKLFCLDTDVVDIRLRSAISDQEYKFDPQEFLHLKVDDPTAYIKADPTVQKWYVKPTPTGAINNGAGAIRQAGRLAFFKHINVIVTRFRELVVQLNRQQLHDDMAMAKSRLAATTDFELSEKDTAIYICGSLAGGTGSGSFLDTAILLRHLQQNVLIHGFFLLHWVYRNKPFAHRTPGNTYAALAELDNLQSIMFGAKGFIPYSTRYGSETVAVTKAPYDIVHLLDGRNEIGQNIDGVENLTDTVANAIFLSMSSMSYPADSAVDNLLKAINATNPSLWGGRYPRYSSIGVSSIHYPATELHRLHAAENALELCRTALNQLESKDESGTGQTATVSEQDIRDDVKHFIDQHELTGDGIRVRMETSVSPDPFAVQTYDIGDPTFPAPVNEARETAFRDLETMLEQAFEARGQEYVQGVTEALAKRLKELSGDPQYDTAALHTWAATLRKEINALQGAVGRELDHGRQRQHDTEGSAKDLLDHAAGLAMVPILQPRVRAVRRWEKRVNELLEHKVKLFRLEETKRSLDALNERLKEASSVSVPAQAEIAEALEKTEAVLLAATTRERENINILRSKPNHVLLGDGRATIVPGRDADAHSQEGAATCDVRDHYATYADFTTEKGIHSTEHYLKTYEEGPRKLVDLFLGYCREKLQRLGDYSVDQALEVFAHHSDDSEQFKQRQFKHLFRKTAALWNYDRARVTAEQAEHLGKIINLGFTNHEEGEKKYDDYIRNAMAPYHIYFDPSYSSTGDHTRIWLLNFAAAIPAYFHRDMQAAKEAYEGAITPTYHIDAYLEMNVPDLFPVSGVANKALRVLGMAIVPGIDVIKDEKLGKGHKFTCDQKEIKDLFFTAKEWYDFREMYAEFTDTYSERNANLLDIVVALLRKRIRKLDPAELRTAIDSYICKVRDRLENRDFSKLVSARLTYRELRSLEDFLALRPNGYSMDIDDYIEGKR